MKLSVAAALTGPLASLPTVKKTTVYHVGNLDGPRSFDRTTGNEADGLAVSEHPEEWTRIAKLGGYPTWILKGRGLFVDVLRVLRNKKIMEAIHEWGTKEGLVKGGTVWEVSWYDDEDERRVAMEFTSEDEARVELEDRGEDMEASMRKLEGRMEATPKFNSWWNMFTRRKTMDTIHVDEMLVYVFAEATGAYDGVWWKEILDPDRLSAPRGAIFQKQLTSWERAKVADSKPRKT